MNQTAVVQVGEESRDLQLLNMVESFMDEMPDRLAEMSYEKLQAAYQGIRAIRVVQWRTTCALLTEAKYRIENEMGHGEGRTDAFVQIAQDFGIRKSSAYEKVKVWETFWQGDHEEGQDKHVSDNKRYWEFQTQVQGYRWFAIALKAEDPIDAITMAEGKYQDTVDDGDPKAIYNTGKFSREIDTTTKSEPDRLRKAARAIERSATTLRELSADDDVSNEFIDQTADALQGAVSRIEEASLQLEEGNVPDILLDIDPEDQATIVRLRDALREAKEMSEEVLGMGLSESAHVSVVDTIRLALNSHVRKLDGIIYKE